MPRGRKSASSLSVVPFVPGQGRPEPPVSLDSVERQIWRDVVDPSLPIGSTLPVSFSSAGWSRRLQFRNGARRGCASCGQQTKTAARMRMPSPLCMAQHPRRSPICWGSSGPLRAHGSCLVQPDHSLSRPQNLAPGRSRHVPRRRHNPIDDTVTGADIIAFIEQVCFIPEGKYTSAKGSSCSNGRSKKSTASTTIPMVRVGRSSPWGARTQKQLLPLACCWRTCAARRRATSLIASSIQRHRAATRRPSREIADLPGTGYSVSGTQRRCHNRLRAFARAADPRRAWASSWSAVTAV